MSTWELLDERKGDVGPWLQRAFWLPLRRLLRMFHILPVTAALIVCGLLASGGQLREIYVSYLEDTASAPLFSATGLLVALRFITAGIGFALISAVLYEAHYLLNTMRFDVIYSTNAELGAGSRLRRVRDIAAMLLVLSPWLGLVAGLLGAKLYLANLFQILQTTFAKLAATSNSASVNQKLAEMQQHFPMPSGLAIVFAILVLGLAMSFLAAANPKNKALQRSIIIITPPLATLLYFLLTDPPAFNPSRSRIIFFALSSISIVAFYYLVYYRLYTMRALVFAPALQQSTGLNLRKFHRSLMFVWALLPWLVLIGFYFHYAAKVVPDAPHGWAMIPVAMSWTVSTALFVAFLLHRFRENPLLHWSIYGAVGLLALAGLLLSGLASADFIVVVYRVLGPLATLALTLVFMISIFALLALLSQRSGFPVLTLVILVVVCTVVLPMSPKWTATSLIVLCLFVLVIAAVSRFGAAAAVAFVLAATVGVNYVKSRGGQPVALRTDTPTKNAQLQNQFDAWLKYVEHQAAKAPAAGSPAIAAKFACPLKSGKYPVFIIAAEGGGIYAASAVSLFLARLEDADPCFSEHVFAISGVSGGSIGATIFQALDESRIKGPSAAATSVSNKSAGPASAMSANASNGCLPPLVQSNQANTTTTPLSDEVSAILRADHFSPVIAAIFPEILGFARAGRAAALAASFEHSVNAEDHEAAEELCGSFVDHWSQTSLAPALVLNATWVETGYRAAYAPFPLHAIDDSLFSFLDQNMPADVPGHPRSLIQAAVVSARFPGVLPPYSVLVDNKLTATPSNTASVAPASSQSAPPSDPQSPSAAADRYSRSTHWNFVDGGYADSSGATTALAMYNALKSTAEKDNAVLRVVLLTSSDPQPKPNDINGTAFADIMGPIDAILSVRDGLANEAVARACDDIASENGVAPGNSCAKANQPGWPLQIVGIDDETYGLSLGWKISQTTFGIVSWMLGEPNKTCSAQMQSQDIQPQAQVSQPQNANSQDPPANNQNPTSNGKFKLNDNLVQSNSCVLGNILNLVEGSAGQHS